MSLATRDMVARYNMNKGGTPSAGINQLQEYIPKINDRVQETLDLFSRDRESYLWDEVPSVY